MTHCRSVEPVQQPEQSQPKLVSIARHESWSAPQVVPAHETWHAAGAGAGRCGDGGGGEGGGGINSEGFNLAATLALAAGDALGL